ncbi:MAG: hypothetical protein U5O15_02660 [Candidatus Krumholzibacteriota bacterium]|nr:hypothetical protein [Candidatus Krumholzibacteriota bacterium]
MKSAIPVSVITLSICYGILLVVTYFVNDFLLIRSDAWYHASVVNEITARGIPPMEPFLPNQPIRYMWIFHLFIATWKNLSNLPLFRAMSFLNIISAFALPYLVARIISSFISSSRKVFVSTLITIAGLESVSWIVWPVFLLRALFGEVRGMEEVLRNINAIQLSGQGPLKFLSPFGTWMVNLSDKFITITSFSFSLNLFLLGFVIFLSRGFLRNSKIKAVITFFVIALGAFLFHIITGTVLICTLVGAGVLVPFIRRYISEETALFLPESLPAIAAILAAVAGLPYLVSLGGTETGSGNLFSEYIHFGFKNVATIVLPLLILFYPARRAFKKVFFAESHEYAVIASWIIPLIILNLFVDLPTRSESKLIFPLFLLLGSVISIEITSMIMDSRGVKRKLIITATFLLFFIPPFLTFRGFIVARPGEEEVLVVRRDAYSGEKDFFEWIRKNTDKNAVFAEKGFNHLVPVFASRRSFAGGLKFWRVYGYNKDYVARHYNLNEQLFACGSLSDETVEAIKNIGFDLYIAVFDRDIKKCPVLGSKFQKRNDLFELVYSQRNARLYHLKQFQKNKKD